jgi:hypothetical protein
MRGAEEEHLVSGVTCLMYERYEEKECTWFSDLPMQKKFGKRRAFGKYCRVCKCRNRRFLR